MRRQHEQLQAQLAGTQAQLASEVEKRLADAGRIEDLERDLGGALARAAGLDAQVERIQKELDAHAVRAEAVSAAATLLEERAAEKTQEARRALQETRQALQRAEERAAEQGRHVARLDGALRGVLTAARELTDAGKRAEEALGAAPAEAAPSARKPPRPAPRPSRKDSIPELDVRELGEAEAAEVLSEAEPSDR